MLKSSIKIFWYYKWRFSLALVGIIIGVAAFCTVKNINHAIKNQAKFLFGKDAVYFTIFLDSVKLQDKQKLYNHFNLQQIDLTLAKFKSDNLVLVPYAIINNSKYPVVAIDDQIFNKYKFTTQASAIFGSEVNYPANYFNLNSKAFIKQDVLDTWTVNPVLEFNPNQVIFIDYRLANNFQPNRSNEIFCYKHLIGIVKNWQEFNLIEFIEKFKNITKIDQIRVIDPSVIHAGFIKSYKNIVTVLGVASNLALFLGAVSVFNVFTLNLANRYQEFGLKLALGVANIRIMLEIITESVILCSVGGLAGALLGYLTTFIIIGRLGLRLALAEYMLSSIQGVVIAGLIGIVASIIPSIQIAKKSPIELVNKVVN